MIIIEVFPILKGNIIAKAAPLRAAFLIYRDYMFLLIKKRLPQM